MKKFKRRLRLLGYLLLIVLASFGLGLMGGIPLPKSNRKENPIEIKIALEEPEESQEDLAEEAELS